LSHFSNISIDEKDMEDVENGLPEEDSSLEEPSSSKASAADILTETASSVSSDGVANNASEEKGDSQTEGSLESELSNHQRMQASGISQIVALLRKNILTKLRTPGATFFELFSPVLMMLVLSAAYTLTDIVDRDARIYASIDLSVPGPWIDIVQRSTDLFNNMDETTMGRRRRKLQKRSDEEPNLLVQMTSVIDDEEENDDETKTWDGIFDSLQQKLEKVVLGHTHEIVSDAMDQNDRRRLQQFRNRVDTSADAQAESYELLDVARDELRDFLSGPVPTPSFSQFVSVSTAMSNVIPIDSLPRIFSETSFGRQWGNILTLGTLHLSPRNQAAEDFWAYLNETYPLTMLATTGTNVSNFRVRLHDDEAAALGYIDATNKEERTWALLDFTDFDLEQDSSSFQIRMNYTTVPNVNRVTNWAATGLNRSYQRYYLSGYMTLQRTVNEFVMAQSGCNEALSSVMRMPMPTAA
jgi:hypothetical protein